MVREFELPDVGEGVAEGELVSWLVEAGDAVSEDQPVAEVETDKALVEVPAPVDGTVRELHVEEGEVVPVGTVIISFDVEGETEGAAETETESEREQTSEPAGVDEPSEPRDATADAAGEPGATGADTEAVAPPDDRVFAPPRVRRMAREQEINLSSIQGSGPGGRITAADVQAATGGEPGDGAAQVQSQAAEAAPGGAESEPSDSSGASTDTDTTEETSIESASGASSPQRTETPTQVESANRDKTLAAPATRRMAEEEGVDLDAVPATEERDGEAFVTPDAVREYAEAQRQAKKQIGKRSKQANRSGRRIPISRRASANAANRSGASASASPRRWSSRSTAPPTSLTTTRSTSPNSWGSARTSNRAPRNAESG